MTFRGDFFWVDAFTDRVFGGNPAGVCPVEAWPEDAVMQRLAWQHGLAETAFVCPTATAGRFALRWFTPAAEVDLCGHATLATAHVLWRERGFAADSIEFETRSGILTVRRNPTGRLELDFPARPPQAWSDDATAKHLLGALGLHAADWLGRARDAFVVLPNAAALRNLRPDFDRLRQLHEVHAVIATAPGDDCDFVSRFFAPAIGVPEDHVTGSAHCTLAPFWAERLGKRELHGRQLSPRGGELWCVNQDDRVRIAGHAVTYLRGQIDA